MRLFRLDRFNLKSANRNKPAVTPAVIMAEPLESRRLFTAGPTITLVADVPTASGITGANGRLTFTRNGSTANPIKVFYHSSGTIDSHQYTKLSGVVIIHGGQSVAYVDIKPKTGLVVAADPVLNVVLTQYKTYRRGSPHVATVTVTENHGSTNGEQFSLPITASAGNYTRSDQPIDNSVNFTSAIAAAGGTGSLNTDSIRVVETTASGTVIDSNVPYQFDHASSYNAATNASGDLIIQLSGSTAANATRYYQVQFATTGTFTAPTFTNAVSVTNTTDSAGFAAYAIHNATATYVMQQTTGGISQIIDNNSNDWVGFNSASGSAGEYRGVPNLGVTGGLHPSDGTFPDSGADATTTIVNSGPLKTTIHVVSTDTNVDVTYSFYKNFAKATINQANEQNGHGNTNYWFLYEGTPGGSFNSNDSYLLSDGSTNTLGNAFTAQSGIGAGNSTTGQWAAFQSASENRFIYFAQNTQDTIEDSYYDLNNQMTVFGFGRTGPNSSPSQQQELSGSKTFTFGIADGNSSASTTINGQYRDVSVSAGTATSL